MLPGRRPGVERPWTSSSASTCRQGLNLTGVPRSTKQGTGPGVNADRWSQAIELEHRAGLAVCDSDPLKLHYSWCLARIGAAPISRFLHELASVREAMSRRQLGFADAILVTLPSEAVLRRQKDGDATRSRRTFELHARLRGPLEQWYRSMDRLRPGAVIWDLQATAVGDLSTTLRPDRRYDVELLDALVFELPRIG